MNITGGGVERNALKGVLDKKLNLNDKSITECARILQNYTLKKSDDRIIQEFYMKFAPSFLKKDLSQYYTPKEIATFMVNLVPLKQTTKALDPCSGSGDFMVGLLGRASREGVKEELEKNIACWDIDPDAAALSQINMILNGDGRTGIKNKDSLEDVNEANNSFDVIITNPPFGQGTTHSNTGYNLIVKQSGKLFVERSLNLLKDKGVLVIILPNGYLDNPTDKIVRDYIIDNARIVGIIRLPDGVFKVSGSGGKTSILILQKYNSSNELGDYNIFVDRAEKVGFDHKKKGIPVLHKREETTGTFLFDEQNEKIIENDLLDIQTRFYSFCKENMTDWFSDYDEVQQYSSCKFYDLKNEYDCMVLTGKYLPEYKKCIRRLKNKSWITLKEIASKVTNKNVSQHTIQNDHIYKYIETGDVYRDSILEVQKLRGWNLPNRAKLIPDDDSILLSKMEGSFNNFLYLTKVEDGLIFSNGFYSVTIPNEQHRYNFLKFVFSNDYIIQMTALASGTIMSDVKEFDLLNYLVIPDYNQKNNYEETREYLEYKRYFDKYKEIGTYNDG